MSDGRDEEWQAWWDARVAALTAVLGPPDDNVGHAIIPFEFGAESGGRADLLYFRKYVGGVVCVTSELIGRNDQVPNSLGNYDLAICHRDNEEWGPNLISRLAYYTRQQRLDVGDTMEIGGAAPKGSSIAALLFAELGRFTVRGRAAGVLLAVGITKDELSACRSGRRKVVEDALHDSGVWPFTDLSRLSSLAGKRKPSFFDFLFKPE
jgi:hypothetical protein